MSNPTPKTITKSKLQQLRGGRSDLLLLDVLPKAQFAKDHIEGAKNAPFDAADFLPTVARLAASKSKPIVVYCTSEACNTSTKAAKALTDAGYTDVLVYAGGISEWRSDANAAGDTDDEGDIDDEDDADDEDDTDEDDIDHEGSAAYEGDADDVDDADDADDDEYAPEGPDGDEGQRGAADKSAVPGSTPGRHERSNAGQSNAQSPDRSRRVNTGGSVGASGAKPGRQQREAGNP